MGLGYLKGDWAMKPRALVAGFGCRFYPADHSRKRDMWAPSSTGQHLISLVCGILQCIVAAAMEYWHNSLPNCAAEVPVSRQKSAYPAMA